MKFRFGLKNGVERPLSGIHVEWLEMAVSTRSAPSYWMSAASLELALLTECRFTRSCSPAVGAWQRLPRLSRSRTPSSPRPSFLAIRSGRAAGSVSIRARIMVLYDTIRSRRRGAIALGGKGAVGRLSRQ